MRYIADGAERCGESVRYAPSIALRTPEGAAFEMEAVTSLSLRLERASHHLVIAPSAHDWTILTREDDEPLVRDLVRAAGMNPNTALYAWARHEDHIHVLLARFDPSTRNTADDRFLVRDLERAALWASHQRGLDLSLGPNSRQHYAELTGQDLKKVPYAPLRHPEQWAAGDRAHLSSWQGRRFPGIMAAVAKAEETKAAGAEPWAAFHRAAAEEGVVLAHRTFKPRLKREGDRLLEGELLRGIAVIEAVDNEDKPRGAKLRRFATSVIRLEEAWGPFQPPSEEDQAHARARAYELRRDEPQRGSRIGRRRDDAVTTVNVVDPIEQVARRLYEADRAAAIAESKQRHAEQVALLRLQREKELAEIKAIEHSLRQDIRQHWDPSLRSDAQKELRALADGKRADVMFATRIPSPPRRPFTPPFATVEQDYRRRALEEATTKTGSEPSAGVRMVTVKMVGDLVVPVFNERSEQGAFPPLAYLEGAEWFAGIRGTECHSAQLVDAEANPRDRQHLGMFTGTLSQGTLASAFNSLKAVQEPWADATRQTIAALSRANAAHSRFSNIAVPEALAAWGGLTPPEQAELQRLMPAPFTAAVWAVGRSRGDGRAWDSAMAEHCSKLPPPPAKEAPAPDTGTSSSPEALHEEKEPPLPETFEEEAPLVDSPPGQAETEKVLPRDRAAARYTYSPADFDTFRDLPKGMESHRRLFEREALAQAAQRIRGRPGISSPEALSADFYHSKAVSREHSLEPGFTTSDWTAATLRLGSRRELGKSRQTFRKRAIADLVQTEFKQLHSQPLTAVHSALRHLQEADATAETTSPWSLAAQATLCQALQSHPDRPEKERGEKGRSPEEKALWARLEFISPDPRELERHTPTPGQAAGFVAALQKSEPAGKGLCVDALRTCCEERAAGRVQSFALRVQEVGARSGPRKDTLVREPALTEPPACALQGLLREARGPDTQPGPIERHLAKRVDRSRGPPDLFAGIAGNADLRRGGRELWLLAQLTQKRWSVVETALAEIGVTAESMEHNKTAVEARIPGASDALRRPLAFFRQQEGKEGPNRGSPAPEGPRTDLSLPDTPVAPPQVEPNSTLEVIHKIEQLCGEVRDGANRVSHAYPALRRQVLDGVTTRMLDQSAGMAAALELSAEALVQRQNGSLEGIPLRGDPKNAIAGPLIKIQSSMHELSRSAVRDGGLPWVLRRRIDQARDDTVAATAWIPGPIDGQGRTAAEAIRKTMSLRSVRTVPVSLAATTQRPMLQNGWSDDDRRRFDPVRSPKRSPLRVNSR